MWWSVADRSLAGIAICRAQRTAEELLGQERGSKDTSGSPLGHLKQHWEGQLSQPWGACSRVPSKAPQWLSHTSLCSFSPSTHPTPCFPNTLLPQPSLCPCSPLLYCPWLTLLSPLTLRFYTSSSRKFSSSNSPLPDALLCPLYQLIDR